MNDLQILKEVANKLLASIAEREIQCTNLQESIQEDWLTYEAYSRLIERLKDGDN